MTSSSSLTILSDACVRARRLPLLGALTFALAAFGLSHAATLGWWYHHQAWAFLPAIGSIALVIVWFVRGRRLTVATLARRLDQEWALSSRLESSVELAHENTALATAQRTDTAARTATQRPTESTAWLGTLAFLALTSLFVISELAVSTGRWISTLELDQQESAKVLTETPFSASITWKKPDSEIKANAIEEVPLVAEFKSSVAPEKISLEISVNGEPRPSHPLDPADFSKLTVGKLHTLALSLYLDETGAQEFDIVAYHLRAEFPKRRAPVASTLQFIQIRPPREDIIEDDSNNSGRPPEGEENPVETIRRLKIAQLQLVKENFLLLHTPVERTDKVWQEENSRVASNQKTLAQKTSEFRESAISHGAPTLVVDNLGQAFPLMETASTSIEKTANDAAVSPQNRALALITATEKIIQKVRAKQPPPGSTIEDPFKDSQKYQPPERSKTPAGRLEELAKKQEEVARELEAGSSDQASTQQKIADSLKELANERSLDPAAQTATEQAARDAAEAAQQLAQNDLSAARSPAASAAEALDRASAAQEAAGRKTALAELEAARREINDAGLLPTGTEQSTRLVELGRSLRESAVAQQQTGSAAAARELMAVSQSLDKAAENSGDADAPALAAARAQAALAKRAELIARAGRQLEFAQTTLNTAAPGGPRSALAEAELAAQLAGVLLPPDAAELARETASTARQLRGGGPPGPAARANLATSLNKLIVALEAARASGQRDELIRRFNPDDIDPVYREPVETYFEQLSRRTKP